MADASYFSCKPIEHNLSLAMCRKQTICRRTSVILVGTDVGVGQDERKRRESGYLSCHPIRLFLASSFGMYSLFPPPRKYSRHQRTLHTSTDISSVILLLAQRSSTEGIARRVRVRLHFHQSLDGIQRSTHPGLLGHSRVR